MNRLRERAIQPFLQLANDLGPHPRAEQLATAIRGLWEALGVEQQLENWRQEAASAGFYESPWGRHPRIQLLTVGELLAGKRIDYPQTAERIRAGRRRKAKEVGGDRSLFDTYAQPGAQKVAEPIRPPFEADDPED